MSKCCNCSTYRRLYLLQFFWERPRDDYYRHSKILQLQCPKKGKLNYTGNVIEVLLDKDKLIDKYNQE